MISTPVKTLSEPSLSAEAWRKLLHLLSVLPALAIPIISARLSLFVLLPALAAGILADWARVRSRGFNRFVDRAFGWMMRSTERPAVGDPISINGATWVLASVSLLILIFPIPIALTSFSLFMVGDAAAAVVGRRFGHHTWGRTGCTIEGSAAFFVAGFFTAILIGSDFLIWTPYSFPVVGLAIATAAACLAEVSTVPVNDNLFAPFIGAVTLALSLTYVFGESIAYFPLL